MSCAWFLIVPIWFIGLYFGFVLFVFDDSKHIIEVIAGSIFNYLGGTLKTHIDFMENHRHFITRKIQERDSSTIQMQHAFLNMFNNGNTNTIRRFEYLFKTWKEKHKLE